MMSLEESLKLLGVAQQLSSVGDIDLSVAMKQVVMAVDLFGIHANTEMTQEDKVQFRKMWDGKVEAARIKLLVEKGSLGTPARASVSSEDVQRVLNRTKEIESLRYNPSMEISDRWYPR